MQDTVLGQALTLLYTTESPDTTPSILMAHLNACLDRYERPRYMFRVAALPLTETGKPARARAQEIAEKMVKGAALN